MHAPKILVPDIADRASFALDDGGGFAFTSGFGVTLKPDVKESAKYVLGLLNSRLLDMNLKSVSITMRGGFFRCFTQFVERPKPARARVLGAHHRRDQEEGRDPSLRSGRPCGSD